MFSDVIQNDMRSRNMGDIAGATIPVVEELPNSMVNEETKQMIIGIMNGMAQKVETDVKSAAHYKPEYSWN